MISLFSPPTLSVNSSTFASPVVVNNSATLKGSGSLQSSVTANSGGTVAPGNSIGTQNYGSLTFMPGSFFSVEISPTLSSLANVSGSAVLDSSAIVQVAVDTGSYTPGTQYTILTANSITGQFSPNVQSSSSLTFQLAYDAMHVYLAIFSGGGGGSNNQIPLSHVLPGNNTNLAVYLNAVANFVPGLNTIVADLSNLNAAQLNTSLNSIDPSRTAANTQTLLTAVTPTIIAAAFRAVNDVVIHTRFETRSDIASLHHPNLSHLIAASKDYFIDQEQPFAAGSTVSSAREDERYAFWGTVVQDWTHQKAQTGNPAYTAAITSGLIGFTYFGSEIFYKLRGIFSTVFDYSYTHLHQYQDAGLAKMNTYAVFPNGTLVWKHAYLQLGAGGIYNQIHNKRHVVFPGFDATARSSYHSWQLAPHFGVGYDFNVSFVNVEPFGMIDWICNWQQAYSERGAGALNMHQSAQTSWLLRSEAGLKFNQLLTKGNFKVILKEKISYVNFCPHNIGLMNVSIVTAPGGFVVDSLKGNVNLVAPGFEFSLRYKNWFVSCSYDGQFSRDYENNQAGFELGGYF